MQPEANKPTRRRPIPPSEPGTTGWFADRLEEAFAAGEDWASAWGRVAGHLSSGKDAVLSCFLWTCVRRNLPARQWAVDGLDASGGVL